MQELLPFLATWWSCGSLAITKNCALLPTCWLSTWPFLILVLSSVSSLNAATISSLVDRGDSVIWDVRFTHSVAPSSASAKSSLWPVQNVKYKQKSEIIYFLIDLYPVVAVDRYNVIVNGFKGTPLTFSKVIIMIIFSWVWALGWSVAPLVGWGYYGIL